MVYSDPGASMDAASLLPTPDTSMGCVSVRKDVCSCVDLSSFDCSVSKYTANAMCPRPHAELIVRTECIPGLPWFRKHVHGVFHRPAWQNPNLTRMCVCVVVVCVPNVLNGSSAPERQSCQGCKLQCT